MTKTYVIQPLIKDDLLRDRSPPEVDAIIGAKHESPTQQENHYIDWSHCPLAQAYPQWEEFLLQLWVERGEALKEARAAHRAATPPPKRLCQPKNEPAPWEKGPSVADIKGNSTRKKV